VAGNAVHARAELSRFAKPSTLGTAKPATIFQGILFEMRSKGTKQ
jgi:hypothetical protein